MVINKKGFSVVEALVAVVVIGFVGAIGWTVYGQIDDDSDDTNNQSSIEEKKDDKRDDSKMAEQDDLSTEYKFDQFGISMDVMDGWEVTTNHSEDNGSKVYKWDIENADADSKIMLRSVDFLGGWIGCSEQENSVLIKSTVHDVAPTQNPDLIFMSWTVESSGGVAVSSAIVSAEGKYFRKTQDLSADIIPNSDIEPGDYYVCGEEPGAGFSLGLNEEGVANGARRDYILTATADSTESNLTTIGQDAQSYSDIKAMLTSIK